MPPGPESDHTGILGSYFNTLKLLTCITVPYQLSCDTCELDQVVDDEVTAYEIARDHEREQPSHYVFIDTVE